MDNLAQEEIAVTIEEESDVDEEFDISPPFSQNKELQRGNTIIRGHSDSRGCLEAATHASSLINLVACHHVSNLTQTTLDQYM